MKPVLPLLVLIPLLILVVAGGGILSWRSTKGSAQRVRYWVLGFRVLALILLGVVLVNPGRWESLHDLEDRLWVVLLDRSASMAVDDEEGTRLEAAREVIEEAVELADDRGIKLATYAFGPGLLEEEENASAGADQDGTDLTTAAEELITSFEARGQSLGGVVVLSDGRQTARERDNSLALRARGRGVRFHGVVFGGEHRGKDLSLRPARPSITAFGGQDISVVAVVESTKLGLVRAPVTVTDAEGKTLGEGVAETDATGRAIVVLAVKAPETSTTWTLATENQEGEVRTDNNVASVHVRVVNSKTRVFLVEGAPYWDSKFLAQMLRNQEHIAVHSVYRLSDERYFRIDTGVEEPTATSEATFPENREELGAYDLVIFGKNVDPFLTPEREAALVDFVRDGGGAVLFSRGRAYSGSTSGLELIEPVVWATGNANEFRFLPSLDGEAAGLFGQALPGAEAGVWKTLPPLKDARRIDRVKPFTRVLAEGQMGTGGLRGRFPLVMVRRYGQGVSGVVNADGLWKWDFYPEARELGNMYLEFWTQLIQWMSSYSEFLPGQDYSLKLSSVRTHPGDSIGMNLSYRGKAGAPPPRVRVISDALAEPLELVPGELPPENGRPRWRVTYKPESPGTYAVSVVDERTDAPPTPERILAVATPPREQDDLSADPEFLQNLVAETGGESVARAEAGALLDRVLQQRPPDSQDAGVEWQSWWKRWEFALLFAGILGWEWWIRRRNGLV